MKILKWILIVLLILAGLVIIVPVFLPSQVTVSVEEEIDLPPELVFNNVAQFTDRDMWDPWLQMEPEAKVVIESKPDFVGSVYTWEGEKIGNGKMLVDSVNYPDFVASDIWFGGSPEPSRVEWILEESGENTQVTWRFISEGSYPFGRLMLQFMKGPLRSSFESGLAGFKSYIEENPPRMYRLSDIGIEKSYETNAMVVAVDGNMEQIGQAMMEWYPKLSDEIIAQGLSLNGPPFAHYLDYDEETGHSNVLLGFPVKKKGAKSGEIYPKYYEETKAIAVTHYGKYDYFEDTYNTMEQYIHENDLEVTGEAFEVYLTTMMEATNPMKLKTMIAFPLKK